MAAVSGTFRTPCPNRAGLSRALMPAPRLLALVALVALLTLVALPAGSRVFCLPAVLEGNVIAQRRPLGHNPETCELNPLSVQLATVSSC